MWATSYTVPFVCSIGHPSERWRTKGRGDRAEGVREEDAVVSWIETTRVCYFDHCGCVTPACQKSRRRHPAIVTLHSSSGPQCPRRPTR